MGALQKVSNRHVPFAERFERSYIPEPNSGCWLWHGRPRGSNAYGGISRHGRTVTAHRASWELFKGYVPDGMFVLHRCDNSACVNPDHLFLGSEQDNSDDKVSKGRQSRGTAHSAAKRNPARGASNGNSKLTASDIRAIKLTKLPQREIAKMYGVTQALISKIKRGEIWK